VSDPEREQLQAEVSGLRDWNATLTGEVERLTRRVDDFTRLIGKGSKNSSAPPSSDSPKN